MRVLTFDEMMKIRKKENLIFGEQYVVKYSQIVDGYVQTKEILYYVCNSRQAHKQVESRFKKDHPDCKIISVDYQ
jgi:glycogen debranching enzyme